MNRRLFLHALGAALIATQVPVRRAMANAGMTWRQRLLVPERFQDLEHAIEMLFPGKPLEMARAFEEFKLGTDEIANPIDLAKASGFGMAQIKAEGSRIKFDKNDAIIRVTARTFAMGYEKKRGKEENDRLERALVSAMYLSMLSIAEQPENQGSRLVWRRRPERNVERPFVKSKSIVVIRMRLGLLPMGWRAHAGIQPALHGYKMEGQPPLTFQI